MAGEEQGGQGAEVSEENHLGKGFKDATPFYKAAVYYMEQPISSVIHHAPIYTLNLFSGNDGRAAALLAGWLVMYITGGGEGGGMQHAMPCWARSQHYVAFCSVQENIYSSALSNYKSD